MQTPHEEVVYVIFSTQEHFKLPDTVQEWYWLLDVSAILKLMNIVIEEWSHHNRRRCEHWVVQGYIPLGINWLAAEATPKAKVELGNRSQQIFIQEVKHELWIISVSFSTVH